MGLLLFSPTADLTDLQHKLWFILIIIVSAIANRKTAEVRSADFKENDRTTDFFLLDVANIGM